jgi:hypothetical protein
MGPALTGCSGASVYAQLFQLMVRLGEDPSDDPAVTYTNTCRLLIDKSFCALLKI